MSDLAFNRIMIEAGDGFEEITPAEWLESPLSQRIRWVLEAKAHFFLDDAKVAVKTAIDSLHGRG